MKYFNYIWTCVWRSTQSHNRHHWHVYKRKVATTRKLILRMCCKKMVTQDISTMWHGSYLSLPNPFQLKSLLGFIQATKYLCVICIKLIYHKSSNLNVNNIKITDHLMAKKFRLKGVLGRIYVPQAVSERRLRQFHFAQS